MARNKISPKNFWFGSQGFPQQTGLRTDCSSCPHAALPNPPVLNPDQQHWSLRDGDSVLGENRGIRAPTASLLWSEGSSRKAHLLLFWPAKLISVGQETENAVILDVLLNGSEVPCKSGCTVSPCPWKTGTSSC